MKIFSITKYTISPWSLGHERKHTSEKPILKYYKQEGPYWICQVEEEERICKTKLKGASDTTTGNTFLEVKLILSILKMWLILPLKLLSNLQQFFDNMHMQNREQELRF